MPAVLPVAGVSKVEFRISDGASIDAGSRFFMQYSGAPPSGAQQNSNASGVATSWLATLGQWTHTTEALVEVIVTDLSSDTGAVGSWQGSSSGVLSAGSPLPASACALVNHQISRRYRGGKPRTYVRLGDTSMLQGTNKWTSTAITNVESAWEGFINDLKGLSGSNWTNIVNISYLMGPWTYPPNPSGRPIPRGTPRNPPLVDQIVSSTINVKIGSQRRRLAL